MGVKWSLPRPVRNGASIMITTPFPNNSVLRTKLWNLWTQHKEDLKTDGFRVKKYNNIWSISYFQDVVADSHERIGSEPKYMIIFRELFAKWQKVHETIADKPPRSPKSEDDEENAAWFVDL